MTARSRTITSASVLVILTLVLAACGAAKEEPFVVPAGAKAGDLVDKQDCTIEAGKVQYAAECSTLVVPENRSDPGSRLIAVPVTRIPAMHGGSAEPLFFLYGGPGSSNQGFPYLQGLAEERDFIQVGYRGVDGSVVLDCPEIAETVSGIAGPVLSDAALDSYRDAAARCGSRLESEGVDLEGYKMTDVIDDMEAVRTAMGYDRINLLGESYGTRLAMLYEWMHPDVLNRVVMVAVNPPGHFVWDPQAVDEQLALYADACARDAGCSARTNDLLASLRQVREKPPRNWLFFPVDMDGVKLISFFMLMESVQPEGAPVPLYGPAMIDLWLAAANGDASGMALITASKNLFLPTAFLYGDLLAKGGSGGDFEGRADDDRSVLDPPGALLGSPGSLYHWGFIRGWPVQLVDEQYRSLQKTDVPTLLIGMNLDFATPPQYATDELLPYLTHGEQVILKDMGHTESFWTSQSEARAHLLSTFFDSGEVDASLYTDQVVNFDVGLGWPGLAKVTLAIAVAVVLLAVAVIWVAVRLVRRLGKRRA
jgi:pimeloyl-ACP methyl ester carboxylesterase